MSPRTITCLTLAGVLLAGAPLLHLTGKRAAAAAAEEAPAAETHAGRTVGLCMRYTGRPESLQVLCGGEVLVEAAGNEDGVWEGEATLPESARWELEVAVRWPEGAAAGAQAVSVSLSPAGSAEMTETQWTFPGEAELHSVYTFTPPPQP